MFAQSNNVAWLAVPLAAVSAVALLKVFLSWAPVFDTAAELQAYQSSALIFAASAVVESFAEPLYTLFARQVNVAVRVKVESFATLVRCVGTFVPVCWLGMGMVGFAVGQALFSVAYVLAYAWLARGTILDKAGAGSADLSAAAVFPVSLGGLAPRLISEAEAAAVDSYLARTCQGSDGEKAEAHGKRGFLERQFHRELFGLSATFTLQSAEKLLLQEGEKLVLVAFGGVSAADQGRSFHQGNLVLWPSYSTLFLALTSIVPPPLFNPSRRRVRGRAKHGLVGRANPAPTRGGGVRGRVRQPDPQRSSCCHQ